MPSKSPIIVGLLVIAAALVFFVPLMIANDDSSPQAADTSIYEEPSLNVSTQGTTALAVSNTSITH